MKKAWLVITVSMLAIQGVFAQDTFNLAKYQSVTADSYVTNKPVQFANDGFVSQDSRWVSTGAGPHWLEIELAVPMAIGSAHLYSGGTWNSAMINFKLQYDNGGTWVDIAGTDVSGNTLPELNLMFTAPVTAQKFRLYTTDGTARVIDLALYPPTGDGSPVPFGTDIDLNLAKLRQVEASSIAGVNYPKLAIDGYADDASCWVGGAGMQELEIAWLQSEKIRGIHLYSGLEGQAGTQIQDFNVDYWNGSTWLTFSGGSVIGNTELEREVRFDASVTTSRIRIQTLDADAPRIRELVVLPENDTGGYPLWTDVKDEAPPAESFMDYDDGYYTIENRGTGLNLRTSTNGSSVVSAPDVWFQLLLNIGTDTYRLRSKESGECFEVSLASTNDGAAIVEGIYASMPHQRWRLVDSGDGTHFRIVNVWSGMVLDLDGANVVQKAVDADHSQQWSFTYQTHAPKKGQVAFFHYNFMYQPDWFYSWGSDAEDDCEYGDYHPMQWGWMTGTAPVILRGQPKWYARAQVTCAMGFNEPDKEKQANIPEEDAADQWPRLERMQLPLVGPCPAQNNGSWRQTYEAIAVERGLRSEYMALHWYAGCNSGNPQNIINVVNNLYTAYGKPVWITEFAVKDWYNDKNWNRNDNFNWLAEFLWRAEGIAHLKKYSLFEYGTEDNNADPTVDDGPTLGLHVRNDKTNPGWEDLSECGLLLAGWDGDATVRDGKAYIIHNKGRSLRLIDDPASNTVIHANILYRGTMDQFMLETAPGGKKYITGLSDGRRLHCNGSSVGLSPAGTLGSTVEWSLQEHQHGWFFINHPSTGKRLRITNSNVIDVDNDTNAGGNLQFRFIRPAQPLATSEVQTLPYAESFESGTGSWKQSVTDDFDWTLDSGYTDTTNTGPSAASDGSQYLYVEGHDNGIQYKTAQLECAFDLAANDTAELTFDYHMYGPYIDYLSVDIFDGTTWTYDVWSRNNQQHFSSEAAWSNAVVDLTPFVSNNAVVIRFRSKQKQWHAADTAIDNIRIDGTAPTPYELWANEAFAGAPPETDTSESGNPDGDNNSNEQEWILATDPLVADSPITAIWFEGPSWYITYTRRKIAGVSVYAEYSPELVSPSWGTDGILYEGVIIDDGEVETVAVILSYDLDAKFIRLEVGD